MLNPFERELILSVEAPAEDVEARLSSRVIPFVPTEMFERSLHPRGAVMGRVSDSRFEIQEAMNGFGGAVATGTLSAQGPRTIVRCRIVTGVYMRYTFAILAAAYAIIAYLFLQIVLASGFRAGTTTAFAAYSGLFAAVWAVMIRELNGLAAFVREVATG